MSRPLLLLIDARSLTLTSVGVGVYSLRLIHGLLRHAPALRFKVLLPSLLNPSNLGIADSRVIPLPAAPRLGNQYINCIASNIHLTHFLSKHHPDALFHATNAFWSPLRPRHTLVTMHDLIPYHFPKYFGKYPVRRFMQRRYERFAARSERILSVSQCTARDLTALAGIPAQKISVHYNFVGEEYFAIDRLSQGAEIRTLREKYGLPADYWLYLGGYDYRKNIEFLIRSYARASKKKTLPPLVLAGAIPTDLSKPFCDVLGALREAGLSTDAVLMPGRVDSDDLPFLYAGASLLIYPSLYEGFGYPAAEAMAVGTPVLVSNTSSLPEIVRRSECRFDPTDEEGLSLKLLEAANDPSQFLCPLPAEFTEKEGIRRYLQIIESLREE